MQYSLSSVLHQLDQKIIYPHYDFKHLTEKYFEIGMKLNDFSIQLVKYWSYTNPIVNTEIKFTCLVQSIFIKRIQCRQALVIETMQVFIYPRDITFFNNL